MVVGVGVGVTVATASAQFTDRLTVPDADVCPLRTAWSVIQCPSVAAKLAPVNEHVCVFVDVFIWQRVAVSVTGVPTVHSAFPVSRRVTSHVPALGVVPSEMVPLHVERS